MILDTQLNQVITHCDLAFTPELQMMHLGHFFFTWPRQKIFLHCPIPFSNRGKPPILQMAQLGRIFLAKTLTLGPFDSGKV